MKTTYKNLTIERGDRSGGVNRKGDPLPDRFYASVWTGKARDAVTYMFRSHEAREKWIAERKACADYAEKVKADRAMARRAFDATEHFKIGDILYSSWGYDQTNVDFYEVLAVTRQGVTIQKIGTQTESSLTDMSESVVPDRRWRGETTKHRVTHPSVRIESYAHATKWDGKPKYQSHYG